jgi:hypothetical protein
LTKKEEQALRKVMGKLDKPSDFIMQPILNEEIIDSRISIEAALGNLGDYEGIDKKKLNQLIEDSKYIVRLAKNGICH